MFEHQVHRRYVNLSLHHHHPSSSAGLIAFSTPPLLLIHPLFAVFEYLDLAASENYDCLHIRVSNATSKMRHNGNVTLAATGIRVVGICARRRHSSLLPVKLAGFGGIHGFWPFRLGGFFLMSSPSLDHTYGALLLGTFLGLLLYGFALHQMYRYYRLYPDDKRGLKVLVVAITLFQTVHITLCMVAVYHHLVTNYDRPKSLPAAHWSTRLLTPFSYRPQGITIVLCQSFFAYRVFIAITVGPQLIYRVFVTIASLFMASSLGLAIAAAVKGFRTSTEGFRHGNGIVSAIFGSGVAVDVLLTGTLVVVLLSSRTGFQQAYDQVWRVVYPCMLSSSLEAPASIIALLVFILVRSVVWEALAMPSNLIYVSISVVGTKLCQVYANSVLAALNSRKSIQDRMMADSASGSNAHELSSFVPGPRNATHLRPWSSGETIATTLSSVTGKY
ncbi:hypothetical protein PYCCODRAFT_1427051 [Trametes coccinea BRFM310]|uniref:DUF6534 domain-containing protein n=1 Tax=Trametes coccinea (strain BRFM310) TaxID=1353009 RepID=A0A1Y2IEH4_TRAC3|nr:hypothetical protein PYCCODRAFT_1427051 [Trametes coccinea BRFM310]